MRFILEKITDLHGLYAHELRVRLSAEKQMVDVMERLIESVTGPELKATLVRHLGVTRNHASQVESLLNHATDDREPIKCKTIGAFKDEVEAALQDTSEPSVLDASLIAIARRIQHYELASYDSARQWARSLQMSGDEQILNQVVEDERATEERLTEPRKRLHQTGAVIAFLRDARNKEGCVEPCSPLRRSDQTVGLRPENNCITSTISATIRRR